MLSLCMELLVLSYTLDPYFQSVKLRGRSRAPRQLTGGKAHRWSQLIRLLLALHMGGNLVKANPQAPQLVLECTP